MQKIKKPIHPAWIEIDLKQLKKNFSLIRKDMPKDVGFISVIKDNAYGHGAVEIGKVALSFGATYLAVFTVDEALELKKAIPRAPIMILGERTDEEFKLALKYDFICCISDIERAKRLAYFALKENKKAIVHIKIDTGMSRYGVRWNKAIEMIDYVNENKSLKLEGVMSHFAASDGIDKTFALTQLGRFQEVLNKMERRGIKVKYRHICNSGGFLDLPQAHFDLVRLGLLPLGVYPSETCRRINGIEPAMSIKCKVASIRNIEIGDSVSYGMRYHAESPRRIATLPVGFGDGIPRARNSGAVLIHGHRASIVGGVTMDSMMVDITDIPQTKLWDEAVIMGKQGNKEISVHEIAKLKGSVSYDVLTGLNTRLPKTYL